MNSRGPLPQPDSKRGIRGTNEAAAEFVQEMPECPKWLKKKEQRAEYAAIVDAQMAAGVGIRKTDAELYARLVILRQDFRDAENADDRQAAQRVMTSLEQQLVIGELHRQRVGIRGKTVQPKSKLALMLASKNDSAKPTTP
jgi:hypothetical protein